VHWWQRATVDLSHYPTGRVVRLRLDVRKAPTGEDATVDDPRGESPIGYTWSYLECRIGQCYPIWEPLIGS
jgi:hypothetical protein